MLGAETLDHIAIPTRDLPRAEKFYLETVGLEFLTQRKNADGSPRHTYVKAGRQYRRLDPSRRAGAGVAERRAALCDRAQLKTNSTPPSSASRRAAFQAVKSKNCATILPFIKSFCFNDPDDNHMELCVRRKAMPATAGVSHVIFECIDLRALRALLHRGARIETRR